MINNLRILRKRKKWTVAQLSAKSNVPVQVIKRMEEADSFDSFGVTIKPIYALMVARPFGVTVEKVFMVEQCDRKPEKPKFYLDII